ncbi:MAG: hypothetical protein ACFFB7_08065, partial [Candidatus Sifarchaeia archaeon]
MILREGRTTLKKAPGGWPLNPYFFYLFALALALVALVLYLVNRYHVDPSERVFGFPEAMGCFGVAVGVLSLGIALASRQISESSDKKMFSIAEYLFHEKMAILNDHLGHQHLDYLELEFRERVIHDVDAALSIHGWVSREESYKLCEVTRSLRNKAKEAVGMYTGTSKDTAIVGVLLRELDARVD